MGLLDAVSRYAYALGYQDQEDDGLGVPSVGAKSSDARCFQEHAQ
jgi:hypothetical protein